MKTKQNENISLAFDKIYLPLIEDLEAANGRAMNNTTAKKIVDALSTVDWKEANAIVRSISRAPNPPRNVYGAVLDAVEEVGREKAQALEHRQTWAVKDSDRLTPAEWQWNQLILEEIMVWHDLKLAARNVDHCEPMDIDEWIQAGRTKTWSTILDHYLQGSEPAYKRSVGGDVNALAAFAEAYYKMLVNERMKRTAKTEEKIFF
jgi:hypothetical protein